MTEDDCQLVLLAAIERDNVPLALSVFGAMSCAGQAGCTFDTASVAGSVGDGDQIASFVCL